MSDVKYKIKNRLLNEGKCCVIGGSYNNGGNRCTVRV